MSTQQPSPLPGFATSHGMLGSVSALQGSLYLGYFGLLRALGRLREGSVCLALTSVDDGEFTVEMF